MKTWLIALVIIAGGAGAGYWYWSHKGADAPEYKTVQVSKADMVQAVLAAGQINPITNVTVGSQISGNIGKLYADFNSEVTNGQLIATIEPSIYKAILEQCRGDLESAKAAEELAAAEAKRANALYSSKLLSDSDYDTAVATLDQAKAMVIIKQAAHDKAQLDVDHCMIYAPVEGTVISRQVDVGQTVAASMSAPTLFQIANDLTKMQIDALVSEADIGGVETNQAVNFTVDAYPGRVFHGIVTQIRNAAQTNQNVISYDTVISVNNRDLKLRPGMTATVSIVTAQETNILRIPNSALRFKPPEVAAEARREADATSNGVAASRRPPGTNAGGTGQGGRSGRGDGSGRGRGGQQARTVYALAAEESAKEHAVKPVQIHIGISDGAFTEVLDGLKEGDEVITAQVSGLPSANSSQPGGSSSPFGGGRGRGF